MKAAAKSDFRFDIDVPELFGHEYAPTLGGLNRFVNANQCHWPSTEQEQQHLLLTLINGETHWITQIMYEIGESKPLLAMLCENPRTSSPYRLVVPKSSILSFQEIPNHQLVQDPKPTFGFHSRKDSA